MDALLLADILADARNGTTFPGQIEARPAARFVTITTITGDKVRQPPEAFNWLTASRSRAVEGYDILTIRDNSHGFDHLTYIDSSSVVAVSLAFDEVTP